MYLKPLRNKNLMTLKFFYKHKKQSSPEYMQVNISPKAGRALCGFGRHNLQPVLGHVDHKICWSVVS